MGAPKINLVLHKVHFLLDSFDFVICTQMDAILVLIFLKCIPKVMFSDGDPDPPDPPDP